MSKLPAGTHTDVCRVLLNQLITLVPGIDQCIDPGVALSQDPVDTLTAICREGSGLCLLFNAAKTDSPIIHFLDNNNEPSFNKPYPLQQFLAACQTHFDLQPSDLFTIDDLDHGLPIQAINMLTYLLKISEKQQQSLSITDKHNNNSIHDKIVSELLETERRYVQDLEALQNYMREAEAQKVLPSETLSNIFGNLSDLVDFQHRFLGLAEEIADRPSYEQQFGKLFVEFEIGFAVYEPFCANVQTAQDIIVQETPRLVRLTSIMNPTFELPSNLIKPVQRLCKYPLLVQELIKATPESRVTFTEQLREGLKAIQRVTTRVNETKRRQENITIVQDLRRRIKNSTWRRSIATFGVLLLQEKFTIERNKHDHHDVYIYLFEKALLICESDSERRTSTISVKRRNSKVIGSSSSSSGGGGSNGPLAVRGRIFISQLAQVDTDINQPGKYKLQLFWSEKDRKTPSSFVITSCTIICRNKEQLQQWASTVQKLVQNEKMLVRDLKAVSAPSQQQQRQKVLVPRPAAPSASDLVYGSPQRHVDSDTDDVDNREWDTSDDDEDDINTTYCHHPQQGLGRLLEKGLSIAGHRTSKIVGNNNATPSMLLPPLPRDGSTSSTPLSSSCASTISTGSSSTHYPWDRKPSDSSTLFTDGSEGISLDDHRSLLLEPVNFSQTWSHQTSPDIHHPLSEDDDDDERDDPLILYCQRASSQCYSSSSSLQPTKIKLRLHYGNELFLTIMPIDMKFENLISRVDKKFAQLLMTPKPECITLKYLDEDGDLITIATDEDIQMGLEGRREMNAFNIYIMTPAMNVAI